MREARARCAKVGEIFNLAREDGQRRRDGAERAWSAVRPGGHCDTTRSVTFFPQAAEEKEVRPAAHGVVGGTRGAPHAAALVKARLPC